MNSLDWPKQFFPPSISSLSFLNIIKQSWLLCKWKLPLKNIADNVKFSSISSNKSLRKDAFGEKQLFVSPLFLHCTVFYVSIYADCSESLTINKGCFTFWRERVTVDLHNSSLPCVDWDITSSILEIGAML